MTKGLKEGEPNGRDVYPDIIDHVHHQSPTRPHMSLYDRSAQFASFDALAGYSDMISEEQRMTDEKMELDENSLENLNQKLGLIADVIADGHNPTLTFTVFVPDDKKAGGAYVEVTDKVKRIDAIEGKVVLASTEGRGRLNKTIEIKNILDIHGELVDYLDEAVL